MSCCKRLILAQNTITEADEEFEILFDGDITEVEQAATINSFGIISPSAIGTVKILKTKCTLCNRLGSPFDAFIDTGFSRKKITLTYKSEDSESYIYEAETQSWQDKAKDIKLWDLDIFEPYIHSEDTIQDSQNSGDFVYSENNTGGGTDKGYWFPHIFFGGLHKQTGTTWAHSQIDYRPVISRRKLLEKAFCAIGLRYESFAQQEIWEGRDFDYLASENCGVISGQFSFLNLDLDICPTGGFNIYYYPTSQLREITEYLIPKWMPTVKVNPKLAHFKARVSVDQIRTNPLRCLQFGNPSSYAYFDPNSTINFDQQIEDSADSLNGGFWGNNYYDANGYTGTAGVNLNINTLQNTQGEWELTFKLIINAQIGLGFSFQIKALISTSTTIDLVQSQSVQTHEFTVNFKFFNNWDTPQTYEWSLIQFQIIPKAYPISFTVMAGSEISGRQLVAYIGALRLLTNPIEFPEIQYEVTSRPDTNTIIFPQSYIDESLTLYEYLGGIAHQLNAFIVEDSARGTLSLEPQNESNWTNPEGGAVERIAGYYKKGYPDVDFSTACNVSKFIDAKDAKKGLLIGYKKGGTNAYAKAFGDNYGAAIFGDVNDLQENRNPFYSPAYDREYKETKVAGVLAAFVPALLDNDNGESLSTGLAYFSLYNYGKIGQWEENAAGVQLTRQLTRWVGGAAFGTGQIAYSSHIPIAKKQTVIVGGFGLVQQQPMLSYGDVSTNMYTTNRLFNFHETDTGAATYTGDFYMKLSQYEMLDFSKRYMISDGCGTVAVRLTKKGGFNCDSNLAKLEFRDILACSSLGFGFGYIIV